MDTKPPLPPEVWEHRAIEAQEYIRALDTRVAVLESMGQRVQATGQYLTEQLQQDAHTSSRPPSSDPPQATAKRPRREPRGRRPGGPPGHEGQARALVPVEAVDVVIPVTPTRGLRCQHLLCGDDPQPHRHQVPEIPPVQPVVTADQLHRFICPVGGEATRAAVPAGVPPGGCGPRVQAIAALCTGAYHLSKRPTQRGLEDLVGVVLSLGPRANLEQATVQAVAEPVATARTSVQQQPAASLDEPGWREGPRRAWLWTAVTAGVTVFVVRLSRSRQVAQELLGECFWGWVGTDRWRAYSWSPAWRRQLCGAHLWRDIAAMIARGGRSREIGEAWRAQAHQMFHWWHRGRDATLAHASCGPYMRPVRQAMERRLDAGQTCGVPKTAGVCRAILKRRQALWTFVRHDGVEPTHNAAERAIRPGVPWRKGSFGTHSAEGCRFVAAMRTSVATLQQPHGNVLDYLTAACQAALCSAPAPSLLPTPDHLHALLRPAA